MIDPSWALQQGILAALTSATIPNVPSSRIYDAVPQNAPTPYVSIGDCQLLPDKAGCIDGVIAYPIINVWSTYNGYKEAKEIAAAVLAKLDDKPENLSVAGFSVIVFEIEQYQPLRDPDGITRRVSLTFKVLLSPN
jgi:hypothetical protein